MPSPAGNRTIKDINDMINHIEDYAESYLDECIANTKEVATSSGKIVEIKDRHIPTIEYFLNIWLPRNIGNTITKKTFYCWLRGEDDHKKAIITNINEQFKSLTVDIVANEGKGVFYAKNKLGWSDKQTTDINATVKTINATFGSVIQSTLQSGTNTQLDQ